MKLFLTIVGAITVVGFGTLWIAHFVPTMYLHVKKRWSAMPSRKLVHFYNVVDKLPPYDVECLCWNTIGSVPHYYVAVYKRGFDSDYWQMIDTQTNPYTALVPDRWALLK